MLSSTLYIAYSSVSITICGIIAFLFWQRRSVAGARPMSVNLMLAAIWIFADLFSVVTPSLAAKAVFDTFTYISAIIIPVVWLVFALEYTKHTRFLNRRIILLFSIIPVLTFIALLTNDFHHLFIKKMVYSQVGFFTITDPTYGNWFWVHSVYSYAIMLLGTFLLVKKPIRQPKIYRNQSIMMILTATIPVFGSIFFLFGAVPFPGGDPTVFTFIISGIFCFLGMFHYRLFNLVPIAREAIIDSLDEFFIVLDMDNFIIDINASAKKVLMENDEELVGKSIYDVLKGKPPQFKKYINAIRTNQKINIDTDTGKKTYDFRIAPLYDENQKLIGRFIVLRDISMMEDTMERLKEAREISEKASKAKSNFLASMSHEIRTPLHGIIGMAELINSANLTAEDKECLLAVQYSANSLLDIINEILDFSKIEAGKMQIEQVEFYLRTLINTTLKSFAFQAQEKKLQLVCNIAPDIPEVLEGDPTRLRQILSNLISNALKFTVKGSITIDAKTVSRENNRVFIQFSVIDTGIGISPDKIHMLFNSFEQLDSSTTRRFGGTGLGLAIVKNLLALMEGNITVESKLCEGSCFSFVIPFQLTDFKEAVQHEERPGTVSLNSGIRILIAEDNKINQALLVKVLERKNIKADVAENGKIALEKLAQNTYDLILMDIQMPEVDGYQATMAIRKGEKLSGKHIPIIALTANATEEDRDKCFACGMDDYMSKPVKSDKLFACIMKFTQWMQDGLA